MRAARNLEKNKFIAPFKMVEIEINSHCNRRCAYCPQSVPGYRKAPRFMNIEDFQKILLILKEAEFTGRISYHFFNEPLLHPQIELFVKLAADTLPNAHQVIFTNGDFLTEEKYKDLRTNGIQTIVITSHGRKSFPERNGQIVQFPEDLNLTNRGGKVLGESETLFMPCYAPSTMLIVGVDGDIILCYEDADRTITFGNIFTTSLEDIWFSPLAIKVRENLEKGNRRVLEICSHCDNVTHTTPKIYDLHP